MPKIVKRLFNAFRRLKLKTPPSAKTPYDKYFENSPPSSSRKPTASKKNFDKWGKIFVNGFPKKVFYVGRKKMVVGIGFSSFESPICVKLELFEFRSVRCLLGEAKLGFEQGSVIIEALQSLMGAKRHLNFLEQHGWKWHKVLLQAIESRARELGFSRVLMRKPETLYYYRKPSTTIQLSAREWACIMKRAKYLASHPKAQLRKGEFVGRSVQMRTTPEQALKDFRSSPNAVALIRRQLGKDAGLRKTQKAMHDLYYFAAKENGFNTRAKGDFYVKEL